MRTSRRRNFPYVVVKKIRKRRSLAPLHLSEDLEMEISSACSTDSHLLFRIPNNQTATKAHLFNKKLKYQVSNFKIIPKLLIGRTLKCAHESIEFSERSSPNEVRKEMQRCYELIHRLGRGVIYLGSSRVKTDHPHYLRTLELGREIANLLDCTSWTGAGPGLMDAAIKGALEAQKPVGGFKIAREAGEWTSSNFHPFLPSETYITCRFFSARKHALVDAVVRNSELERTAVVALPGGIGTLDEIFEILALIQLERIGTEHPIPFLLMNYDYFYSKLLGFLDDCENWGTVAKEEVASLWKVCSDNFEALEYLAKFYNIPQGKRSYIEVGRTHEQSRSRRLSIQS